MDEILDSRQIERLRDLGDDVLIDLAQIYTEDTPLHLEAMRSAIQQGDAARLRRAAHSLKGSSANLGAARMAGLCQEMETRAKHGSLEDAAALLQQISEGYEETLAALQELVRSLM